MNREIKFRVFANSKMHYPMSKTSARYGDLKEIYFDAEPWDSKVSGELMQYTGLKDKNDKEIYEGDIVNVKYCVNTEIREQFNGEVKFGLTLLSDTSEAPQHRSTAFYIKSNDPERENVGLDPDHNYCNGHSEITIIGNIFENPELLK